MRASSSCSRPKLDSRSLGVPPDDPRTPVIWRLRIEDLTRVLDELDVIEGSVPGLAGRLNRDRIAAAGHSWGATTASALLGARILDQEDRAGEERGPDCWTDAYTLSPGQKSLLTMFGGEHSMGGITGYSVTETTDENPERVALVQQVTTTYLRSALGLGDDGWSQAHMDLQGDPQAPGRLESK